MMNEAWQYIDPNPWYHRDPVKIVERARRRRERSNLVGRFLRLIGSEPDIQPGDAPERRRMLWSEWEAAKIARWNARREKHVRLMRAWDISVAVAMIIVGIPFLVETIIREWKIRPPQ